ncbi:hypothetical protein [Algibacter lectus]|uniref:hypothetical protein n=1 Tax=Algibacter lectus TaxID=221126 RepID=UPI0024948B5E|nr:hypothetical protein [Algibacter lectus]
MIPTVNSGMSDGNNANLNHLPFVIKPEGENPLKGRLEIVKDLMLDYDKENRYNLFNKRNNIQEGSFNIFGVLMQEGDEHSDLTTSTIFNEGEMSPPPNG